MRVSRKDLICAIALFCVWLLVWIPRLHGPIDLRWDGSTYFVLGTAIAEGKGYRLLNEPGEIEAVQYPPLLPLIVAAHERLLGTVDYIKIGYALRCFYFIISGIYLLTVYAVARKLFSPIYSLFASTMISFTFYGFLHPSDTLYADLPFALLSTLFLLCSGRSNETPYHTVFQGVFCGAAYLLRTAGITLMAAWVLEAVIRKQLRQATVRAAISLIPVLVWQGHIHRVTSSSEYRQPLYAYQRAAYYYSNVTYRENVTLRDPFRPELGWVTADEVFKRTLRNIAAIPISLGESAFLPSTFGASLVYELHRRFGLILPRNWKARSSRALSLVLTAAGLLTLAGSVSVARTSHWLLSLFFACTLVLVTITPWQSQFRRYLAAVAPLTVIFLIFMLLLIGSRFANRLLRTRPNLSRMVTFLPLLLILTAQIVTAVPLLNQTIFITYYDQTGPNRWQALDLAFDWLRLHTNGEAIIATTVPHLAYLHTGHRAVLPPMEPDAIVANRLLDEVPVSYLVLDQLGAPGVSERYAASVVSHAPDRWRLVFTAPNSRAQVYERVR